MNKYIYIYVSNQKLYWVSSFPIVHFRGTAQTQRLKITCKLATALLWFQIWPSHDITIKNSSSFSSGFL